jgi:hypothetical protein
MKTRFRFIGNNKMKVDFCFIESTKTVPCAACRCNLLVTLGAWRIDVLQFVLE